MRLGLKQKARDADHRGVAARMPDYDPRIIERAAEKLHGKAAAIVPGCIAVGVVLGSAFGAVPLTSLGDAWPIPATFGFATALLGAVFGGVVGFVIGDTRAFGYRLQAQATLNQVRLERNTALAAQAMADLAAAAQAGRLVTVQAPAAEAEQQAVRAAIGLAPPASPPVSS